MIPVLIAIVVVALLIGAIVSHRRRVAAEALAAIAERRAAEEIDIDALRAELEQAREGGDEDRVHEIEDRIRVHEYWKRRASANLDNDRVDKRPTTISDWNTNEKRFNNLR